MMAGSRENAVAFAPDGFAMLMTPAVKPTSRAIA
jgi:hypothetical protein